MGIVAAGAVRRARARGRPRGVARGAPGLGQPHRRGPPLVPGVLGAGAVALQELAVLVDPALRLAAGLDLLVGRPERVEADPQPVDQVLAPLPPQQRLQADRAEVPVGEERPVAVHVEQVAVEPGPLQAPDAVPDRRRAGVVDPPASGQQAGEEVGLLVVGEELGLEEDRADLVDGAAGAA